MVVRKQWLSWHRRTVNGGSVLRCYSSEYNGCPAAAYGQTYFLNCHFSSKLTIQICFLCQFFSFENIRWHHLFVLFPAAFINLTYWTVNCTCQNIWQMSCLQCMSLYAGLDKYGTSQLPYVQPAACWNVAFLSFFTTGCTHTLSVDPPLCQALLSAGLIPWAFLFFVHTCCVYSTI